MTIGLAKAVVLKNQVRSLKYESKLKLATIIFTVTGFWFVAYWLFFRGFVYLQGIPAVGAVLSIRVLALFFLTLFSMLIFSNVLISFSTLYRSPEMSFLINMPIDFRSVFSARFVESLTYSSWAFLFLGTPLMISYGIVVRAAWYYYVVLPLFFIPFVVIAGAAGAALTMVMVRFFPRISFRWMIFIMIVASALVMVFLYQSFDVRDVENLLRVDQILNALKKTQSAFFPSHWFNQGVIRAAEGNLNEGLFYFGVLLSNAMFITLLALLLVPVLFYKGWATLRGSARTRRYQEGSGVIGKIELIFRIFRASTRSLLVKDFKMFWRDASQWSQFVIFFGLMAIYVANLRKMPDVLDQPFFRNVISFLNLAATALVTAVLTSRFIFPLLSLEGRRFWVVGLAPIKRSRLLWEKFFLSVTTTSLFTGTLIVFSCLVLRVEPLVMFVSIFTILLMNFSLAGLAVGFGAIYPNFREDNPARIVSGLGGTLNFLLSLSYIIFTVVFEAVAFQLYSVNPVWQDLPRALATVLRFVFQSFPRLLVTVLTVVFVLSVAATALPMFFGLRSLKSTEF